MPLPDRRTGLLATGLLIGLTAVWGSTFFLIRDLVQTVPPLDFLAVRFDLAAVLMVVVFWRPLRALGRREWLAGLALGGLYGVAQVLQTLGLARTDASVSGFLTGLYVVLTPCSARSSCGSGWVGRPGPRWPCRPPVSPCCRCGAWRSARVRR